MRVKENNILKNSAFVYFFFFYFMAWTYYQFRSIFAVNRFRMHKSPVCCTAV